MTTRQAISRRAPRRKTRRPGRERRQALLQAAYELLCEKPLDEVSFRDIADRADVPEGSAYHFFANRFDLFGTLAADLSERFVEAHRRQNAKPGATWPGTLSTSAHACMRTTRLRGSSSSAAPRRPR